MHWSGFTTRLDEAEESELGTQAVELQSNKK